MELGDEAPVERLDAALLGRSELIGDGEIGQVREGPADLFELGLELGGQGRDGGGLLGMKRALGVFEQRPLVGRVGNPVGADQIQGFPVGQAVARNGVEHGVLVFVRESAKAVGQGGADLGLGQLLLGGLGEMLGDVDAAADPVGAFSEQAGDRILVVAVVLEQGVDDLGLVHRGQGARGCVGQKHKALGLFRAPGTLDHDGQR